MEHVNDDMDELFRRAAEGYPLNTDSADWNGVERKLSSAESVKQTMHLQKKSINTCCGLVVTAFDRDLS